MLLRILQSPAITSTFCAHCLKFRLQKSLVKSFFLTLISGLLLLRNINNKNKKEKKSLASDCVKLLGTDDIILLPSVLCKLCHYLLSLRPSFMNCNCWHTQTRLPTHPLTHTPTHPHTQGVCMWACLQTLSLLIAGFVFYSKCWWGSVVCTKYEVRWDEQALTKSPLFPQQSVLSCNAIKD